MTRIEDYAIIGDTQTVALVSRRGSIDWLCFPRFDSPACFAKLLGHEENGAWSLGPADGGHCTSRRYVGDSLVLETRWDLQGGSVTVTDYMPPRGQAPDVVRIVEGVSGRVDMASVLRLRFDYGEAVPWVRRVEGQLVGVAGPDAVYLRSDVRHHGEDLASVARFAVEAGQTVSFVLTWHPSHLPPPKPVDPGQSLRDTYAYWEEWYSRCRVSGEYADAVTRSLLTLKALTYSPTGGLAAAATTSLPEALGGVRNWDYRYCWLRDATLTIEALMHSGFTDEASEWAGWLLRAVAGDAEDLQIMYGLAGERRLTEFVLDCLPGYEGSAPVRVGNAAAQQFQLDVYGEVMAALALARRMDIPGSMDSWPVQLAMMRHLEKVWDDPDEGLWEVRGPRRHFTHSKVMSWVAFDRAAAAVERLGLRGDARRWRAIADEIHREVCEQAYDGERGAFVQSFGSKALDAAVLVMPRVGFLRGDDPRFVGTVHRIRDELTEDGFVRRYETGVPDEAGAEHGNVDGLPGQEGAFLACSFWLADAEHYIGEHDQARRRFERLLDVRNDVGLLAEQYDPASGRQLGNFPQAFSHLGLTNTAYLLSGRPTLSRKR
jgi:GH15 family glucan-1,4-alpha-glucosidase